MVPVGAVMPYAGPMYDESVKRLRIDGFLFCVGTEYFIKDFPELYAVIRDTYGKASANCFRVPDYRGMFLRGADAGRGTDPDESSRLPHSATFGGPSGGNVGSSQADEFRKHNHFVGYLHHRSFSGSNDKDKPIKNSQGNAYYTESRGGNETRPVNIYVNYIICFESFPRYDLPSPVENQQYMRSGEYGYRTSNISEAITSANLSGDQITKVTLRGKGILDGIALSYANGASYTLGGTGGDLLEFALAKGEYITKLTGHYNATFNTYPLISKCKLATSKGRVSAEAGQFTGIPFEIAAPPGYRIAGLFGSALSNYVSSIGAYFVRN